MPFRITVDMLPMGYALTAARKGEPASIQQIEFISSEDGEEFITRLEGLPDDLLKQTPNGRAINRSTIDHIVAIIHRDKTATVYLNELQVRVHVRAKAAVKAGQYVSKDDIADIESLDFGIFFPSDAGVIVLFSAGWRKGFFYDLTPLRHDSPPIRTADLNNLLGQYYAQILFQGRFSIQENEWDAFFANQIFPFIGLSNDIIETALKHIRAGWGFEEINERIIADVKAKAPSFIESWKTHVTFNDHIAILERAVERFLANDYVSCAGLLFTRIEGLLRSNHMVIGSMENISQGGLSASAVETKIEREKSLLLPARFREYLEDVYFANFKPNDFTSGVSRNSVGHGVANANLFDAKAAAIGLLVVHQLFFTFETKNSNRTSVVTRMPSQSLKLTAIVKAQKRKDEKKRKRREKRKQRRR